MLLVVAMRMIRFSFFVVVMVKSSFVYVCCWCLYMVVKKWGFGEKKDQLVLENYGREIVKRRIQG